MVDVRDLNAVALPDRATVKRLVVRRQRRPRAALRGNCQGQQPPGVGSRHQEELREALGRPTGAKPGWYYQGDDGSWKQK